MKNSFLKTSFAAGVRDLIHEILGLMWYALRG